MYASLGSKGQCEHIYVCLKSLLLAPADLRDIAGFQIFKFGFPARVADLISMDKTLNWSILTVQASPAKSGAIWLALEEKSYQTAHRRKGLPIATLFARPRKQCNRNHTHIHGRTHANTHKHTRHPPPNKLNKNLYTSIRIRACVYEHSPLSRIRAYVYEHMYMSRLLSRASSHVLQSIHAHIHRVGQNSECAPLI